MGVDRTDYIIYGWKMEYSDKYYEDKLLKYVEGHKNVNETLVVDGMCGDYAVFGTLIDHCDDDGEGWDFVELSFQDLDAEALKKLYKELFETEPVGEPKLLIFSHYS